jgi:hypothetical protein
MALPFFISGLSISAAIYKALMASKDYEHILTL